MKTVIGIAGSLRAGSYNAALLRAAVKLAPADMSVEIASIAEFPLYNADLEAAEGVPQAVGELKDRIAASDALLLVTPEYNNSMPGVFKNAIDWLSRPPSDIPIVFRDLPVGLIGATPGKGGTRLAQTAWLPVLRTLGAQPWFGAQVNVANAARVFDADGELVDAEISEQLENYMAGLSDFIGD